MNTGNDTNMISVLLVDDHAVVREGYRRLLERSGDIIVAGEAADSASARELFMKFSPNVVVMDITLPGESGISAMRRMLDFQPEARVLMFSMHEDPVFPRHAMQAGACGYITKSSAPSTLVEAVHAVACGKKYLSASIAQELAIRSVSTEGSAQDCLSTREMAVVRLLVQGQSLRQIAQSLALSPKTVANYQSAIKQKLGADTAFQLLKIAGKLGLDPS